MRCSGPPAAALPAGEQVGLKALLPSCAEDELLGVLIPGYTLQCIDPRTPAVPQSGEVSGPAGAPSPSRQVQAAVAAAVSGRRRVWNQSVSARRPVLCHLPPS